VTVPRGRRAAIAGHRRGAWTSQLTTFPKGHLDGLTDLEALPEVRIFRGFARFPWLTLRTDGDVRRVEYEDLAFEDHPLGGPMALRLTVDPSGRVRTVELGHRL
jgi:hypothetical protein